MTLKIIVNQCSVRINIHVVMPHWLRAFFSTTQQYNAYDVLDAAGPCIEYQGYLWCFGTPGQSSGGAICKDSVKYNPPLMFTNTATTSASENKHLSRYANIPLTHLYTTRGRAVWCVDMRLITLEEL